MDARPAIRLVSSTRPPAADRRARPAGRDALERRARSLPTMRARELPARWWEAVTPRQMAVALAIATGLVLTG